LSSPSIRLPSFEVPAATSYGVGRRSDQSAGFCPRRPPSDHHASRPLTSRDHAAIGSDERGRSGDNDNQIDVSHADQFVERLRGVSAAPVVYFRLPGAQHSFDLFRSLRFDQVVDGIVAFLGWTQTHTDRPDRDPETVQAGQTLK
jgi:acetyl esterase/lipase